MEVDEITVVVHGARNLHSKKPGRCKFSVIFGVGNKKYRTSVVKEPTGNPDWNEESTVHVQNQTDNVFFTVTEKDDVLGQVQLPVQSLSTVKGQVRKVALKAHKKCPVPHGELLFQAYVSKEHPHSQTVTPQIRGGSTTNTSGSSAHLTGFARFRQNLATSPALPRRGIKRDTKDSGSTGEKEEKKRGSTLSYFNKKLSKSLHDIFHIGRMNSNDEEEERKASNRARSGSVQADLALPGDSDIPVITNIIPNMATVHGGTRLCVEGRNLGLGKSDIMEFMLCGVDLLDTIEFESENRVYVITKPNTPGKGDLWIETVSGGQNVVKNVFTFVDRAAEKTGSLERQTPSTPIVITSSPDEDASSPSIVPANISQVEKNDLNHMEAVKGNEKHSAAVHRSSSQQDRSSSYLLASGASTLPRVKSTTDLNQDEEPVVSNHFRKNHQKHTRHASESIVAMQREAEGRSSASEKAELQKEIVRLVKENEALHKKNEDLNLYIQDLVAKVMETCPDVLAAMPTNK